MGEMSEQRYTLEEARIEMGWQECRNHGHDYDLAAALADRLAALEADNAANSRTTKAGESMTDTAPTDQQIDQALTPEKATSPPTTFSTSTPLPTAAPQPANSTTPQTKPSSPTSYPPPPKPSSSRQEDTTAPT